MMNNRNPWYFPNPVLVALLCIPFFSCARYHAVENELERLNLTYRTDSEGDYRVEFPLEDGRTATVGVSAHSIDVGGGRSVRRIWSVAARLPGDFPENLATGLLSDSWSSRRLGSWALAGRTSDGRQVIVYQAWIPSNADSGLLRAAMQDAALSAAAMSDALKELEDS